MTVPSSGPLARMRDEALVFESRRAEMAATVANWAAQAERIRRRVASTRIEDDGATIHVGRLSPGCEACKAGEWDCVFGTLSCNLACRFCLSPRSMCLPCAPSALGSDLAALCRAYARCGVRGVGFSGGEPLLDPERLLHWISVLRREFPGLYLWTYTNGLLLTSELLAGLVEAGLDELRFNLAATGYSHPHVSRMLQEAVGLMPSVAVEIPAIPDDEAAVLAALPSWADTGVRFLNLHELIFEPGSHSENMPGVRAACTMPDGHRCAYDPRSEMLVANVFIAAVKRHLPFAVNFCSIRNKARQIEGRRRMMAAYLLQPTEHLREDGQAESVCFFDDHRVEFVHPSALQAPRPGREGWQAARIRRLVPLHPGGIDQWVHFELIPPASAPSGHER